MARDIALIEPDPQDWAGWVTYLLEQLEVQAEKHKIINQYQQALAVLADKVQNRIKGGKS